ncbi:MAG TPA: nucleotidyltransferase family protein [Coxiellaceae bacterium]|nr:nucleotidyltransferase family protein [Coxiellaceae bacterium]
MKAMILAAGRGERLRPLTDSLPKPLLQVGKHRLIEYHLFNLARCGIKDVIINVSYLREAIMDCLGDGRSYGVNIHYSVEPEVLETGGGIFQALQLGLLDKKPFILLSADVWTEYPLENLPKNLQGDAHLIMVDNPSYNPRGDFGLTGDLITLDSPMLTYGSLGVLNPRLFEGCGAGFFKLAPLLSKAIHQNQVGGVHYRGPWFNIGTAEELEGLRQYLSVGEACEKN